MQDELDLQMEREAQRQDREGGDGSSASQQTDAAGAAINNAQTDNASATADTASDEAAKPAAAASTNTDTQSTSETFEQQLERISEGSIKTPDELKAFKAKLGEFDNLSKKVTDYEAKLAISPYADDYEAKRNELKRSGATKEQLKAFEQINDLGDLSTLDPKEKLIMKMILVDGVGEKVARLKVEKEYPIDTTYDTDLEIMTDDLTRAARDSEKALNDYKIQISTPANDKALIEVAGKEQLESALEPVLEDFTTKYNSLAVIELGKDGEQAVSHDIVLNDDDKSFMATNIKTYLVENNLPLTQENYNEALGVARERLVTQNLPKILADVWKKAETHFLKKGDAKFENTGGKPLGDANPNANKGMNAEEKAFKDELLGGKLR